jgi:predicted ribosome quality control (RQC) complex YloA/Tae2 family protein
MISKEELRSLIETIKKATGLGQEKISIGAGYKKTTLTERLSQGGGLDAVYDQLKLVYGEALKKSMVEEAKNTENKTFTPDQLFAMFLEVSRAQTAILDRIESKMAQETTQAKISEKVNKIEGKISQMDQDLTRTLTAAERIVLVQDRDHAQVIEQLLQLQVNKDPSQGSDKGKHRSGANGGKQGKSHA